jgi:acyl-CoA synthetase (AMP-forming)/AMP-acid ligase II
LFVPTGAELKEPRRLARWLRENEITVLHLTPALGRLLCTAGEMLPAARRIFFGGDALMRSDVEAMRQCAPNARIVSFYGATETQRAVGYHEISRHDGDDARCKRNIPIGKGAKDVQLLLLTAHGQMAGVGELAELYICSPHLAAGYLHDDELTAANFLANPFMPSSAERSDRLYRSGELGRYNLDGDVEWVGRSERRANIRGFRVELAEVEAALSRHPSVGQVAVVAKAAPALDGASSGTSDQCLVAYVEAAADQTICGAELHDFLMGQLPHYMVPAHFHLLPALPLGPNGKVDYAKLAAQDEMAELASKSEAGFEAPLPGIEFGLAEIFRQVLGVAHIGRRDNFFHLGGHSLLAAQAAARIRQAFGVGLDLRTLFEAPTVEALAQRIEALRGSPAPEREEIEL